MKKYRKPEEDLKKGLTPMSSLILKKWVLPLKRGLYATVPLDVGVKGADSFILHNFVIASHLVEPYYIGQGLNRLSIS